MILLDKALQLVKNITDESLESKDFKYEIYGR